MSFDEQPDGDPHGECAAEIRRLKAELDAARAQAASAVKILVAIHRLLFPPEFPAGDGRKYQFNPDNPREYMQALSDAIRAIPDQIPDPFEDTARLDFAENNPELVYQRIGTFWANAGRGFREGWFNFRGAIDDAMGKKFLGQVGAGK